MSARGRLGRRWPDEPAPDGRHASAAHARLRPVPWPFDLIGGTVRSVLGESERAESDLAAPIRDPRELEAKLDEAVTAIHRASESLEAHVEVLGTLSDSLPGLTDSVTRLSEQLAHMMRVTEPLAVAERDVTRLDRLLRRRAQAPGPAGPPGPPEPPEPAAEPPEPAAKPEPPAS